MINYSNNLQEFTNRPKRFREVCKTFMRRFDPGPRLQFSQRINTSIELRDPTATLLVRAAVRINATMPRFADRGCDGGNWARKRLR